MAAKVHWREDRGAWYITIHRDGRKKWRKYGPSKADRTRAQRDARAWNRALERGQLGLDREQKTKPVPFDAFAWEWYRTKVELPRARALEGHLRASTAKLREIMIRLHLVPALGQADVRALDVSAVADFWTALLEKKHPAGNRPLRRRTLDIAVTTLRLILADAVARGLLAMNPVDAWRAVQPKGLDGKSIEVAPEKVLDATEREALLDSVRLHHPHYYGFMAFLALTGVRIGEAIALTWECVDLETATARVYRTKTGGQRTDLELSERLQQVLREHRAQRLRAAMRQGRPSADPLVGLVFTAPRGGEVNAENFRRLVWSPAVKAAFGKGRHLTPHVLRHTWCSLHLAAGTPIHWIREQGGWASAKMLLDTYGHLIKDKRRGYADRIDQVADPDGPMVNRSS